jgi:hypothetical protein
VYVPLEDLHELDGPDEPLSQERFDEYEHDLALDQDQDLCYRQFDGGLLESPTTPKEEQLPW